jgi:uncharacterized protein (DUF924 family)
VTPAKAEEVLAFWFGRPGESGYGEYREVWFKKDDAFDEEVRTRFLDLYEQAARGELDAWREEARSCLALIIVLDQFPRNMFRGDPKTYATDERALALARHAREQGFDRELAPFERHFVYMPFMHSEDIEDQRLSVELFDALAQEPGGTDVTEYARGHAGIVERFGRFPHRNEILGRETTPEEAEFLKEPGSSF